MSIGHFFSKVAGVTFDNNDGSSRQEILRRCVPSQSLTLQPEPDNPHSKDGTAIKILTTDGTQLGYVPTDISGGMTARLKRGQRYSVFITELTGGTDDKPTRGCNLIVFWMDKGESQADFESYISQHLQQNIRQDTPSVAAMPFKILGFVIEWLFVLLIRLLKFAWTQTGVLWRKARRWYRREYCAEPDEQPPQTAGMKVWASKDDEVPY